DCTSDFNACCSKGCYMDKGIGALTCQGEDPPTADPNTDPQGEQEEEAPAPEPDMESEVCKECGSNLGASDCGADDNQCLVDQCKNDEKCTECKMDCDQYADL
ncbi:MAG: hypothetical protein Q9180_009666, partial [Flavoplaca navasiana]